MAESPEERAARLGGVALTYFACMMAVGVYDALISLQKEYNRIWKKPWGVVSYLYMSARWLSLIILASCMAEFYTPQTRETCLPYNRIQPGLCMIITISCELILIVRCYSIWNRSPIILWGLLALMVGEVATMIVAVLHFEPVPLPPGTKGPCISSGPPGGSVLVTLYWVAPMILDTIITVLTFIKAWQLHQRGLRSQLFKVFVYSQGIYFLLILSVNAINTAFYLQPDPQLQTINSAMSLFVTSILACRLVLALKDEEMNATNKALDLKSFTTFKSRPQGTAQVKSGGVDSKQAPVYPLESLRKQDQQASQGDLEEDIDYKGQPFQLGTRNPTKSYGGVTIDVEKTQASYIEPERRVREF